MSILSKHNLIHDIECGIASFLTVEDSNLVVQTVSKVLSMYDVETIDQSCSNSNTELLDAFLDTKRIEGRSEKTIERYRYIITKMHDGIGNVPINKISVFHLRKYLADEKSRGICDSTLDSMRQIFSTFFGWLQKEGLIKTNPTTNLGAIKYTKKVRKPYTMVDIEQIKEHCKKDRDKAIISLLLSTGCRISEICSLDRDSVDFNNMEILVLGKGNKERTVFIDDVTAMHLKRYLDSRTDQNKALFIGKRFDRLQPGGVRLMLKRLASKAGVDNIHPHRFRRTLATNLIGHGMPIQEVASILGHDRLDTTMKYVYLDKRDVKNNYRKYV